MGDLKEKICKTESGLPVIESYESPISEDFLSGSYNANDLELLNIESPAVSPRSPRVYVAPRAKVTRQDSFPEYSTTYAMDQVIEGSRNEEMDELTLSCVRVGGSPRALVYPRALGSSSSRAFVSMRAVGSSSGAGLIETTAPFESVKEAVSKFGGITDWTAHRIQTIERRKLVEQELEKLQDDIAEYKKQAGAAKGAKQQVLDELETTKKLVEELKLDLDKAQTEEQQVKQDSELVRLRVEEMEQGRAEEASVAAKAQLEVAKARHSASVSALKSVMEELELVRDEYEDLMKEKDLNVKKCEEAFLESKKLERRMEELTVELVATKELLELEHSAFLEAQEKKFNEAMARDQDIYNWDKEMKIVEDEIERLSQKIVAEDDVKNKLDAASAALLDLTAEVAAYTESLSCRGVIALDFTRGHKDIQTAVVSAMKELEEVKLNIEKANTEVESLKAVAGFLQSEIEKEKSVLAEIKNPEGIASVMAEDREEMMEIPLKLREAVKEAEEAKLQVEKASEELRKAEEDAGQAKARTLKIESEIGVAKKEMEASKASEKMTLASIKLIKESNLVQNTEDISSPSSIMMSLEEYYELNRRAHNAEERVKTRIAEANLKLEVVKLNETKSLERLAEVNREMDLRKKELKIAMKKAEKARDGKLGVERELRKMRTEKGQPKKIVAETDIFDRPRDANPGLYTPSADIFGRGNSNIGSLTPSLDEKSGKKKKKLSSITKAFMFLSKKKSHR